MMMRTAGRLAAWRLWVLAAGFATCAAVVLARLINYQVLEFERFHTLAENTQMVERHINPKRGALLDANRRPLAISVMYDNLYVYGPYVKDAARTAALLAPVLEMPERDILAKIDPDKKVKVLVKERLPAPASARVESLALPGLELVPTPYRNYPEGSIAPQVLGFVGVDGRGLAGLELGYDDDLFGEAGRLVSARDTTGQEITVARREYQPARDGYDLVLTIDRYLQRVAERELQRAVAENKGIGGQLLIMDPSTGGLLAAASWPTYSLTESIRPDQQALMKPTIATNVYEPGSVMKIVTLAAALDEGVVTPETTTQDGGSVIIDGVRISNWDHNGHGTMTMRQMLIYSSNVGSSFVSGRLGPERFYKYIDLFGFGQLTGIRLPGEAEGSYRTPEDPSWRRIDLATNSFGQGIAVTPLQMLTAVASIANDGILMRPMLVKEMRRGDEVVPNSPGAVRRTVSSATAEQMTDIMISVMEQPGLKAQNVPGYVIAGKSGTADFPTTVGYLKDRTYASFIGFGPTQNPRWAMLVRIDAPEAMYGGAVAAPVFKRMAEELMTYLRIPPTEPRPTPRATTGTR